MKKKQKQRAVKANDDKPVTLGDRLNEQVLKSLKDQKQHLQAAEEEKALQAEEKKREERRQKEKNKSFEELFNESSMDWKNFK